MIEKKKERKAKEMNKKMKGKVNKEKSDDRKREKCWKEQSETKKGLNKNKKWRLFGWISFVV